MKTEHKKENFEAASVESPRASQTEQTGDNATWIVPPVIVGRMSGASWAQVYASGFVRVTYEDGETEGANLTPEQLTQGRENFFSLVAAVQSYRPNTARNLAVNADKASTTQE